MNEANDVVVERFRAHFEVCVDDSATKVFGFLGEARGDGVNLHNESMVQQLLECFKMDHCKPSKPCLLWAGSEFQYQ